MLISWMLYVVLFTAAAGVGALALDHIAGIWQLPRRGIWTAALLIAAVAPVLIASHRAPARPPIRSADTGERLHVSRIPTPTIVHAAARARARLAAWHPGAAVNSLALRLWIALSTSLALLLLHASARLAGRRRSWERAVIDGVPVLIADDIGPAVVGFLRPAIVFPAWAIDAPASDRSLMLRHECEHLASGDPRLLSIAALALVLCAFDLPLWWLVRRLRLAIELDCDRRVLRTIDRPRDYGRLLIAVGARRGRLLPLAAPLAEQRPFLERRILAMTAVRPSRPLIATAPFAAIAFAAVVAGAQVPTPAPRPAAAPTAAAAAVAARGTSVATGVVRAAPARAIASSAVQAARAGTSEPVRPAHAPDVAAGTAPATLAAPAMPPVQPMIPVAAIRALIAEHYPGVISGDASSNVVTIVLDANKRYVQSVARHVPVARSVAASADGHGQSIRIDSIGSGEMRSAYARAGTQDTTVVWGNGELLAGLPVTESQIAAVDLLSFGPKVIGPNPMRVLLVRLKPAR